MHTSCLFYLQVTDTAPTLLCFALWTHSFLFFVHHRMWVHHGNISFAHLLSFICRFDWSAFALQCAHSRFSFVHHRMWVHHGNISLCIHLFSFISKSTNTPHQLFSALHTVCTLVSPLFITGCKCIMIIFPYAYIFFLLFAWRLTHRTNSSLLCTLYHSFLLCSSQDVSALWW